MPVDPERAEQTPPRRGAVWPGFAIVVLIAALPGVFIFGYTMGPGQDVAEIRKRIDGIAAKCQATDRVVEAASDMTAQCAVELTEANKLDVIEKSVQALLKSTEKIATRESVANAKEAVEAACRGIFAGLDRIDDNVANNRGVIDVAEDLLAPVQQLQVRLPAQTEAVTVAAQKLERCEALNINAQTLAGQINTVREAMANFYGNHPPRLKSETGDVVFEPLSPQGRCEDFWIVAWQGNDVITPKRAEEAEGERCKAAFAELRGVTTGEDPPFRVVEKVTAR